MQRKGASTMQILRASGYRRMPWKNGGGETLEIAVSPPDASLETMDWRISMALVESDGPFSTFPGVDRTLTILDGLGLHLSFEAARESCRLDRTSLPFAFPADLPVRARLIAGAVTDLNVMTQRRQYRHIVSRLEFQGREELQTTADEIAVFCSDAESLTVAIDGAAVQELRSRDCAILHPAQGPVALTARGRAVVLIAAFYRTAATPV